METLDDLNKREFKLGSANAFVAWGISQALSSTRTDAYATLEGTKWARPYLRTKAMSFDADFQPVSNTAFLQLLGAGSTSGRVIELFERVPMKTPVAVIGTGSDAAAVVDEGGSIPVANFTSDTSSLTPKKVAIIVVFPKELAVGLQPRGIAVVQRLVIRVVGRGVDDALFDPTVTGSLADGGTTVASTGSTAEQIEADVFSVITTLSGGAPERPILVLSRTAALRLVKLRSSGVKVFPDLVIEGLGSVAGVPAYVAPGLAGDLVVGLDGAAIAVADDGVGLKSGGQGFIATSASPAETISLFQQNAISIRAIRLLAWKAAEADSVTVLTLP